MDFSGLTGMLFGSLMSIFICYTCAITVSYRQRWSTVCGKIHDITLRCKNLKKSLISYNNRKKNNLGVKTRKMSSSFENLYDNGEEY